MRFLVVLVAILFSALPSLAGWDTNFWPTATSPSRVVDVAHTSVVFQSDVVVSQVVYALHERVWAVDKDGSSTTAVYDDNDPRWQEQTLQAVKNEARSIVSRFLNHTTWTDRNPINAKISNLVYWTASTILSANNLPADFWTNTPVRNLMGTPGPTNMYAGWMDGSVYGFESMRTILTNLLYTFDDEGLFKFQDENRHNIGYTEDGSFPDCPPVPNCSEEVTGWGPFSIGSLGDEYSVREIYASEYYDGLYYIQPPRAGYFVDYGHDKEFAYRSFEVGPDDSPLINRTNIGYSFVSHRSGSARTGEISDEDLRNCGFLNFTNRWDFLGINDGSDQRSQDGTHYIAKVGEANKISANYGECSVCDFISLSGSNPGDMEELACIGLANIVVYYGLLWPREAGAINSTLKMAHIIKWDFDFE